MNLIEKRLGIDSSAKRRPVRAASVSVMAHRAVFLASIRKGSFFPGRFTGIVTVIEVRLRNFPMAVFRNRGMHEGFSAEVSK